MREYYRISVHQIDGSLFFVSAWEEMDDLSYEGGFAGFGYRIHQLQRTLTELDKPLELVTFREDGRKVNTFIPVSFLRDAWVRVDRMDEAHYLAELKKDEERRR